MTNIRVPLAVDAQIRVPVGPILLPLRALLVLTAVSPIALLCLGITALPVSSRLGLAAAVLMLGFTLAAPMREGIWIGTWFAYRVARGVMPTAVLDGQGRRARVRLTGTGLEVSRIRPEVGNVRGLRALRYLRLACRRSTARSPESSVSIPEEPEQSSWSKVLMELLPASSTRSGAPSSCSGCSRSTVLRSS